MDFIDEIKLRVSVTDLAGAHGDAYVNCPHQDCVGHAGEKRRTHIMRNGQAFKCFLCDRGGDVFTWYQAQHACSFKDAYFKLADIAGLSLKPNRERSTLLQKLVSAASRHLLAHPDNRYYLEHERGLGIQILFRYQIGYVDPEGSVLADSGLTSQQMEQLGITIKGRSCLAGRYIFPIRDLKGRLVQLKGRQNPSLSWGKGDGKSKPLPSRVLVAPKEWGTVNATNYLILEEELYRGRQAGFATLWEGEPDTYTAAKLGYPAFGLQGSSGLYKHASKLKGIPRLYIGLDNDLATERKLMPELLKLQLALPKTDIYRLRIPHLSGADDQGIPLKVDLNDYVVKFSKGKPDVDTLISQSVNAFDLLVDHLAPDYEQDAGFQDLRRLLRAAPETLKPRLLNRIAGVVQIPAEQLVFGLDPVYARTACA